MGTLISYSRHSIFRKILVAGILAVLFVSAYVSIPHLFITKDAAATSHNKNVVGWIFAQGSGTSNDGVAIGLISMNSDTDGSLIPYGVNVNVADKELTNGIGIFSGEAYGENIGYISFNLSDTGPPPFNKGADYSSWPSPHLAHVAWATGKVTGWARALTVCQHTGGNLAPTPCVLDVAKSGGWDGWIKLSNGNDNIPNTPHDWQVVPATSGVRISANTFSGWAWGENVMGWINFGPLPGGKSGPVVVDPDDGVCKPSDPTFTAGPCVRTTSACGAGNVGETIIGSTIGSCTINGSTVYSAQEVCDPDGVGAQCGPVPPPPSPTPCPFPSTDPQCTIGDGKCSNGENPKNSIDCKAKWWQF
jgi:hypothetical protein